MPTRGPYGGDFNIELTHRLDHVEPGSDCALGVILVRSWVAKIDDGSSVAHVLGNKAIKASDDFGDSTVISSDYVA